MRVFHRRAMHFLISLTISFSACLNAAGDAGVADAMISWTLDASATPRHPCTADSSGMSWRI